MTVLHGEPLRLDVVYRPMAWVLMVPPAGLLGLGLWWFGRPWIAPLPILAALIAHSALFWFRGDRPCTLSVHADKLQLHDPKRGQRLTVSRSQVHSATLTLRARGDTGSTAVLVFWDTERPLLSIRAACAHTRPSGEEVDGDVIAASIGGDAGTAYAFAPVGAVCRQLIHDPKNALVQWYRALDPAVRGRTAARLWAGESPPLDLLGRHEEVHTATLLVGETIELRDGDQPQTLAPTWTWAHATRDAVLLHAADDLSGMSSQTVELAVLHIDGRQIAFPAPLAGDLGDRVSLTESSLHTHSGEGAAMLYQLLRTTPRAEWPKPLATAMHEARVYLGGSPGEVG